MNTAEQILVIFLSTALTVFLVVAICAAVYAVRLLKTINRVAEKAEGFVDSAEAVSEMARNAVGALSLSKVVRGIVTFVHDKQKEGKHKGTK